MANGNVHPGDLNIQHGVVPDMTSDKEIDIVEFTAGATVVTATVGRHASAEILDRTVISDPDDLLLTG